MHPGETLPKLSQLTSFNVEQQLCTDDGASQQTSSAVFMISFLQSWPRKDKGQSEWRQTRKSRETFSVSAILQTLHQPSPKPPTWKNTPRHMKPSAWSRDRPPQPNKSRLRTIGSDLTKLTLTLWIRSTSRRRSRLDGARRSTSSAESKDDPQITPSSQWLCHEILLLITLLQLHGCACWTFYCS